MGEKIRDGRERDKGDRDKGGRTRKTVFHCSRIAAKEKFSNCCRLLSTLQFMLAPWLRRRERAAASPVSTACIRGV